MTTKAPPSRRHFASEWDEIDYLYHKLLYWFYDRQEPRKARCFADRLENLLSKASADEPSIVGEGCRSLLAEVRGDLPSAIKHRQSEIKLIRRLHELSRNKPGQDYVFRRYDDSDLSDRLELLATLYHDSGDLDQAIRALEESKRLCAAHGIAFDGQDLLEEYQHEKQGHPAAATEAVGAANVGRRDRRRA